MTEPTLKDLREEYLERLMYMGPKERIKELVMLFRSVNKKYQHDDVDIRPLIRTLRDTALRYVREMFE
jgi:hypothetical protein